MKKIRKIRDTRIPERPNNSRPYSCHTSLLPFPLLATASSLLCEYNAGADHIFQNLLSDFKIFNIQS